MMEEVKVILWGAGTVGKAIAKMLLDKKGVKIAGIIDSDNKILGKDLGGIINLKDIGAVVTKDEKIISELDADVVILSVDSYIKNIYPYAMKIIESGKSCIVVAEEMTHPYLANEKLSKDMDKLAKEKGVTILGMDINEGYGLDTLIMNLSSACNNIKEITARRVNDLSNMGINFIKNQGAAMTLRDFEEEAEKGVIVGHIGLKQAVKLIAKYLGIELDNINESIDPVISNTYRETEVIKIEPGMSAGCNHTVMGMREGKTIITLEHIQEVKPESEAVEIGDYIDIKGDSDINISIKQRGASVSAALVVATNMIPQVIAANPGLKTMRDFPIPHAIENSFVDQITL